MKRRLLLSLCATLLALALIPSPTLAQNDVIGVYFDTAGATNTASEPVFTPFPVYLLLMNPGGVTTDGFECTVTPVGAPYFILATTLPAGSLDIDASANGFAVGAATPFVNNGGTMLLCTWTFMMQATTPLQFFITQATAPSMPGGLPVVTGGGVTRQCRVWSGDVSLPVAAVNGTISPPINPPLPLSLDIAASAGGLTDAAIVAGTSATSTDAYDGGTDTPKPTPPPGDYICASFEHNDWPMGPRFSRDIRAGFDTIYQNRTWPLLVETDQAGDVTLTFTPSFAASSGIKLHLKDLQTGQYHDLLPDLTYVFNNDGLPNSYRFEILVGAAPTPPPLNPQNRYIPAGWSLVGLPLTPAAGATLGTLIIDPAPGYAYLFNYAHATGYRSLPASTAATQGTGYWLATDTAFTWTMTGTRDIDGVTVALENGWNLVGNANWFPGPFEGLRVIQNGTTYEWLTAAQMGLVSADVQSYDNGTGAYVDAVDLQPWHGYWINALQDGLSLQFHYANFIAMPKRLTAHKGATTPVEGVWRTDLTLTDAAGARRAVTIGQETSATAGFDPCFDRPLPPTSPAGGPRLQLHHPEWHLAAGSAISRDLVGLDEPTLSWTVVATSPNPGHAVLSWDPSGWPSSVDLQLYIPSENRVVVPSMRKTTTYELNLGARAQQIVIRTPDGMSGVPTTDGSGYTLSVSPNPFNPQTVLGFDLPSAARAEVRIYSVRGELVAVVDRGACAAGPQQAIWRGTDRQGREAPSGSYFARLYVDGFARGEVTKLCLVR